MRISVSVADVGVELEEVSNLTIDGVETLLNRAVAAALLAYAGLVDIDSLVPATDEEDDDADED